MEHIRADAASSPMTLPSDIFKAYDIRGVVGKTLTPPIVHAIGQALGSLAQERGRDTIVIARDGRNSGPELLLSLASPSSTAETRPLPPHAKHIPPS